MFRKFRSGRKPSQRNRRLAAQVENLEQRQLMFADALAAIDHVVDPPPIAVHPPVEVFELAPRDDCIDFEDLGAAATYVVGDTFVADNTGLQASIRGEPFTWSNGVLSSTSKCSSMGNEVHASTKGNHGFITTAIFQGASARLIFLRRP